MGIFWHGNRFDRFRNSPAILKCVMFVTTSPGLPYLKETVFLKNSHYFVTATLAQCCVACKQNYVFFYLNQFAIPYCRMFPSDTDIKPGR